MESSKLNRFEVENIEDCLGDFEDYFKIKFENEPKTNRQPPFRKRFTSKDKKRESFWGKCARNLFAAVSYAVFISGNFKTKSEIRRRQYFALSEKQRMVFSIDASR
jgi:hypothetical protein